MDLVNKLQYDYEYDSIGRLVRTNTIDSSKTTGWDTTIFRSEYGYDQNNNLNRFVTGVVKAHGITIFKYRKKVCN